MKYFKYVLTLSLALSLFISIPAMALNEYDNRIWEANEVLKEYMQIPEKRIPPSLLSNAKAIAIFPSMLKGGFIVAGQYGDGIVLYKDEKTQKWSAPAFFRMSGASVGFQIGGQSSDSILVITSERGVRGLLMNKFTLGADASVAAGPTGRDAEAKTDWKMNSSIYSYSRSKGLFAGVSLEGMLVKQDVKANEFIYGEGTTADSILLEGKYKPTAEAKELIQTLDNFSE